MPLVTSGMQASCRSALAPTPRSRLGVLELCRGQKAAAGAAGQGVLVPHTPQASAHFSPRPPLGYAQHLGGAGRGRAERRSPCWQLPASSCQPPDTCPLLPEAGLSTRHLALLTSTISQGLTRTFLHLLPHLPPGNSSAVLPALAQPLTTLQPSFPKILFSWDGKVDVLGLYCVSFTRHLQALSPNPMCCRSVLE